MRLTSSRFRRVLGSAAVAAVASLAFAPIALAGPDKPPVVADDRAVAFDGDNVDINHKDACTVGGLTGTPIAPEKFTFTGGKDQLDLDITAAPANVTVTGVVVKGSDAYNVYLAAKLGALPWNDLRSPVNNGGNVPADQPLVRVWRRHPGAAEGGAAGRAAAQGGAAGRAASEGRAADQHRDRAAVDVRGRAHPAPAPAPAGAEELAETGFGSAWLLGLGAALVAGGAAVLLVLRRRRA